MLLNVTEIGSPKVDNGVVSGFSSSNYLEVTPSFNVSSAQNWEMVYKIITSDKITTGQTVCGHTGSSTADPIAITTNTSKHFALTVSSSTSSSFINAVSGTYTMLPNTTYWLKLTFDSSRYVLSYSLDGINFTEDVVKENTKVAYTSNLVLGRQQGNSSEFPFLGSIDLNGCYIKINGELWWTGMVEGGIKPVRSYVLKHRKQKFYKNVEVEKSYKCFTISENSLYYYALEPLNLGDTIYNSTVLATSISEISKTAFTITTINSNGSIVFSNPSGMLNRNATPYASGDLIGVTTELVESTKDDYDVVENLGESYYALKNSITKYYKEVVTENKEILYGCFLYSNTYYHYVKPPYKKGDPVYGVGDYLTKATSVSQLSKTSLTIFSVNEDGTLGFGRNSETRSNVPNYSEGDLTSITNTSELVESTEDDYDVVKKINSSYSLCREKK